MNSDYSASDTDVPTLMHLVVPGDPRKRQTQTKSAEASEAPIPTLTKAVRPGGSASTGSSLDTRIDRIVNEVLVLHLNAARKEIAARIKSEVFNKSAAE